MAIAIETKIAAPITWYTEPKFNVEDLRENRYNEVIKLIKHHYFREEPMCRSIELLQDRPSVKAYLELIRIWMKDTTSLVAISNKSGRVVGALITRLNSNADRTNTYSRVQLFRGEALEAIMHLKSGLIIQANAYEALGLQMYLRIYLLSVHPSYKNRGVGDALAEACKRVAVNMKIPIIAGIFTSTENQLIAERAGYLLHTEIPYNNWLVDEEVVFSDPGIGNYSAAFMVLNTEEKEEENE